MELIIEQEDKSDNRTSELSNDLMLAAYYTLQGRAMQNVKSPGNHLSPFEIMRYIDLAHSYGYCCTQAELWHRGKGDSKRRSDEIWVLKGYRDPDKCNTIELSVAFNENKDKSTFNIVVSPPEGESITINDYNELGDFLKSSPHNPH